MTFRSVANNVEFPFFEFIMLQQFAKGIDEDIDISELDAELDAIDELSLEDEFGETEVPPYLQDEVVEPSPAVPAQPAAATGEQVDEFGLPVATPAGA